MQFILNGVWGLAPSSRLSASLCRCIVQRLGVADYKHPCLSRDASPRIFPGTDAGRVCTRALHDAKPASIHSLSPGKGGRGIGILKMLLTLINELFGNLTHSFLTEKN